MRTPRAVLLPALILLLLAAALILGCSTGGSGGGTNPNTAPPPPVPKAQLSASPQTIPAGQSSTLTWGSNNATSVSISPAISQSALALSGSQSVTPTTTTTYTISATGAGGTTTATVTITVNPLPVASITVTPASITSGQPALVQWTSSNATGVTIVPSVLLDQQTSLPLNGSAAIQPSTTTTYTITATGPGGAAAPQSATVTVTQAVPTVQLTVNPSVIKLGGTATLSWVTTNTDTLLITDNVSNQVPLGGSNPFGNVTVPLPTETAPGTYTYTASAFNKALNQTVTKVATLTVSSFGATLTAMPNFIQAGQPATLTYAFTTNPGKTISAATIDGGAVSLTGGTLSVSPAATHTYTLTATESDGLVTTVSTTVAVAGGVGQNIQNVVIMVQGNHSFDNYFGKLGIYRANDPFTNKSYGNVSDIDGVPDDTLFSNPDPNGNLVNPFHQKSICMDELLHGWNESHQIVDKQTDGTYKMDKFLINAAIPNAPGVPSNDPLGLRAISYYTEADIPYYYELATQFATSDRWFAPLLDDVIPNRMYIEGGTSFGTTFSGVFTPAGAFQQPTIFNKLTAAGIPWRYYTQDATNFLAKYSTTTPAELIGNVRPLTEYFNLLAGQPTPSGDTTLAPVIFIESGGDTADSDEVPDPGKGIQRGEQRVARIINALMANQTYWPTSAFFLTYDEPGGFFDHVSPVAMPAPDAQSPNLNGPPKVTVFPGDFLTTGMRVPLIVVSPWIKPHYVSKVPRDSTALLKFIETRFNLGPLTLRDAAQDDMTEMFDFVHAPTFLTPPVLPGQQPTRFCDEANEGNNH